MNTKAYKLAQEAMTDLKCSILMLLDDAGDDGLKNSEIGRSLGIYGGHSGNKGHEGHIPRTVLSILENEEVVVQDPATKHWKVKV